MGLVADGALTHGRHAGVVMRDLLAVAIRAARHGPVAALREAWLEVLVTGLALEVETAVAAAWIEDIDSRTARKPR